MTETEYQELLTGEKGKAVDLNAGKGKMLAILMDRSGSMAASHCEALRAGAKMIGQVFADSAQAPFEHFYAISYDHEMKEYKWNGN